MSTSFHYPCNTQLSFQLARSALKLSPQSVKALYNVLEVTFDPLTLCSAVTPLLKDLHNDPAYAAYIPLLQRALLSRLLFQLSQVYSSVKIVHLLELVAPIREVHLAGTNAFDEEQIEAYVMGCARRGELSVRVDHAAGSITFADNTYATPEDPSSSTAGASTSAIQPSTSDFVRTRLSSLATCLHNSVSRIHPPAPPSDEEKQARFTALVAAANAERHALQIRRNLVARRRELLSELSVRKEKEEASRRAELSRRERDEELRKTQEEQKKREQERQKRDFESIRMEEAKKLAQSLKDKGTLKVDITVSHLVDTCILLLITLQDVENLNTDSLMRMQVEQLEKEKKELSERMRVIAKRLDHVERAYRKEERPLLAKDYEIQQANDKEIFEATQKARLEDRRNAHQQALETKKRLSRMMDDYNARKELILGKKGEEYAARQAAAQKKIEEEKAKRRAAVLKAREEERLFAEEEERRRREKEEEEVRLEAGTCCMCLLVSVVLHIAFTERIATEELRAAEEAATRAAEEAQKKEEEDKAAAIRRQREEERAAALEEARKRMQREEEAAQRARERKTQQAAPPRAPPAEPWRRSTAAPSPRGDAATPPRAESPAPAAAASNKYRPGALAKEGGWRTRSAEKEAEGGAARPASPAPRLSAKEPTSAKEEDGFQTVEKKQVWRPSRGRGRGL